jgi:hypothetical protein
MSAAVERALERQRQRNAERDKAYAAKAAKEAEERQRLEAEEAIKAEKAKAAHAAAVEAHRRACELWGEYDALERANKPCPRELLDKCLATPRPAQYVPTKEELRRGFAKKRFEVKHFTFKADPTLDGYCGGGISAGRVIRSSGGMT